MTDGFGDFEWMNVYINFFIQFGYKKMILVVVSKEDYSVIETLKTYIHIPSVSSFVIDYIFFKNDGDEMEYSESFIQNIVTMVKTKGVTDKTIVVSFTPSVFTDCGFTKYIAMTEGGCSQEYIKLKSYEPSKSYEPRYSVVCSGIGVPFLGLYRVFEEKLFDMDTTKKNLLKYCVKDDDEELLTEYVNYSYCYPGKSQYIDPIHIWKYLFLIINLMNNNEVRYVFTYDSLKESDTFKRFTEAFNIFMTIQNEKKQVSEDYNIVQLDNGFNLLFKTTIRILKIRYFPKLEKLVFLSLVKNSTSPNFGTGDLSTHEALSLKKFIIHDYYSHKKYFYNSFIQYLIKTYITENKSYIYSSIIQYLNLNYSELKGHFDINSINYFEENKFDKDEFMDIMKLYKFNIDNEMNYLIGNFKLLIKIFENNFDEFIQRFDFNKNFKTLLAFIDNTDSNIQFPNVESLELLSNI